MKGSRQTNKALQRTKVALVRPTERNANADKTSEERMDAQIEKVRHDVRRQTEAVIEILKVTDRENVVLMNVCRQVYASAKHIRFLMLNQHEDAETPVPQSMVTIQCSDWWTRLDKHLLFDDWFAPMHPAPRAASTSGAAKRRSRPSKALAEQKPSPTSTETTAFQQKMNTLKDEVTVDTRQLTTRMIESNSTNTMLKTAFQMLMENMSMVLIIAKSMTTRPALKEYLLEPCTQALMLKPLEALQRLINDEVKRLKASEDYSASSATEDSVTLSDLSPTTPPPAVEPQEFQDRKRQYQDSVDDFELDVDEEDEPKLVKRTALIDD